MATFNFDLFGLAWLTNNQMFRLNTKRVNLIWPHLFWPCQPITFRFGFGPNAII